MTGTTPQGRFGVEGRPHWGGWVTPKLLKSKPVHRWYTFPHSFTDELVHALAEEWGLGPQDRLLDPFCGAGTTLLATKERGIPAVGYDLSPLAVLVAGVKVRTYDENLLREAWEGLKDRAQIDVQRRARKEYPELIEKALPGQLLGAFEAVAVEIECLPSSQAEKDFFLVALLSTLPKYSRAIATGGWLKWIESKADGADLAQTFDQQVQMMLQDLSTLDTSSSLPWRVALADARSVPDKESTYSAVVTSPPYPNRHDYTRVFGVELMFALLSRDETKALRYQSFHSHPEARPARPASEGYVPPMYLLQCLEKIRETETDSRVLKMLEGYFLDMFIVLRELRRVCKSGAKIALVVGNVQYRGVPIVVDELTAELGEQAGLSCEKLLVARFRGNSAQQMKLLGKTPSRETVVTFTNP